MANWVLIVLGAICVLAAIVFVYRGIGGRVGGAKFTAFGVEIAVQEAGQAGITLVIGAALLVIGAHNYRPTPPLSVISYVRDGTNQLGEFRRSGSMWLETFPDLNVPRYWTEVADPPAGKLRLASGGAIIDIDFKTKAIDYSDDGKKTPTRLDTITSTQ